MVTNVFNSNLKRIRNTSFTNATSVLVIPGKYLNHDLYIPTDVTSDCILFTYKYNAILCSGTSTTAVGFAFGNVDYQWRVSTSTLTYIGTRNATQSGLISSVTNSIIYTDNPSFTFNLSTARSGILTVYFESFSSNYAM